MLTTVALPSGTILGAYEILAPLGTGGMGEVYRARDSKLRREVAVKVLREDLANDAERLARFEREARLLAQLNHPNIAILFGLEEDGPRHFLVMELVLGQTLSERLHAGSLTIRECLALARQIAEALEAAHGRGVIHRDLKPSNIKITPEGRVKLLDFGLAKALEPGSPLREDSFTTASMSGEPLHKRTLLGTPAYMSPEQVDSKPADQRSDIWSYGCILYESLSGRQPFCGETVVNTLAAVIGKTPAWEAMPIDAPPRLRNLVQRCLAKDPNARPRDLLTIRRELEEVARDLATSGDYQPITELARPDLPIGELRRAQPRIDDSLTQPLSPPVERRRAPPGKSMMVPVWLLILMVVAALVSGGVFLFWPYLWPVDSVAVLPFTGLRSDDALDGFADRLAEDITKHLTGQSGLNVAAHEKVARVTDLSKLSPNQAAVRLSVRGILTGRIEFERAGTILTIHAELHDTKTDKLLWEQRFSRRNNFSDEDTLGQWREHIAKEIAEAVGEKVGK